MELPQRYPYNPSWRLILLIGVFFGACCAVMADKAVHNVVGLTINGIIHFGPNGASAFYWGIASIGAGFVLLAFLLAMRRLVNPQMIEIGTDALLFPRGWFRTQTTQIVYSDIQSVAEVQASGQRFLNVIAGGRKFTMTASLFSDAESYCAVKDFLLSHAPR
jgi:hypothetical protein